MRGVLRLALLGAVFYGFISHAQESYRDLLKAQISEEENAISFLKSTINQTEKDEKLAVIFNYLGLQYQYSSQFDSALACHQLALEYALSAEGYGQEIGVSYNKIGIVHYYQGSADSAYIYIKKGIPFFKDPIAKANAINNLALMSKFRNEPDEAIKNYLESLKIYQTYSDTTNQIGLLNNIGALYFNLGQDSIAESYFNRSLALSTKIADEEQMTDSEANLATIYFNRGDFDRAISIHKRAIDYYQNQGNVKFVIVNQNNLANAYSEQGMNDKALGIYFKVLELMNTHSLFNAKEAVLFNVGSIYQERKNYKEALRYYKQSLSFARENELVYRYIDIYESLSSIYRDLNDIDSSLHYKNLHIKLKDSLDAVEKEKRMMELESEHQNGELTDNLVRVKAELSETERKKNLTGRVLMLTLICLSIVGTIVLIFYGRNKKNKALSISLQTDNHKKEQNISLLASSLKEKEKALVNLAKEKGNVKLPFPSNLEPLTSREKEVLNGVKDGLKDQEIADRLFISIATVRTHLRKAYVKIDARNRAEAIQFISIHDI